jgi:hypothetical protein
LEEITVVCPSIPIAWCKSPFTYSNHEAVMESPLILNATSETAAIVLKLSEPLLHNGYALWLDNYYTSPDQVKFLNPCNMDRMGTMKISRIVPKKVKEKTTKG